MEIQSAIARVSGALAPGGRTSAPFLALVRRPGGAQCPDGEHGPTDAERSEAPYPEPTGSPALRHSAAIVRAACATYAPGAFTD